MRLVSYRKAGTVSYGVVVGDALADVAPIAAEVGATIRQALERNALGRIAQWAVGAKPDVVLESVEFLPVIPDPQKILCVGINYHAHVRETGRETPAHPMIFTRFADSQSGHLQPILRPSISQKLDFEGELAVVIGKAGRYVEADRALDHVAGYSAYNDGSIRAPTSIRAT